MKNKKQNFKTIDLHGYKEDEVYDAVDRFIMKNLNQKRLRIMTGKGQGIVQRSVLQYLQQAGYHWQYESINGKKNTGCLIVMMD